MYYGSLSATVSGTESRSLGAILVGALQLDPELIRIGTLELFKIYTN